MAIKEVYDNTDDLQQLNENIEIFIQSYAP